MSVPYYEFSCNASQGNIASGPYVPVHWTGGSGPSGVWDVGQPSRLYFPPGLWMVGCQGAGVFSGGLWACEFGIGKNGILIASGMAFGGLPGGTVVKPVAVVVGDYVEMLVKQTTGSPQAPAVAGSLYPALWAYRLDDAPGVGVFA